MAFISALLTLVSSICFLIMLAWVFSNYPVILYLTTAIFLGSLYFALRRQ